MKSTHGGDRKKSNYELALEKKKETDLKKLEDVKNKRRILPIQQEVGGLKPMIINLGGDGKHSSITSVEKPKGVAVPGDKHIILNPTTIGSTQFSTSTTTSYHSFANYITLKQGRSGKLGHPESIMIKSDPTHDPYLYPALDVISSYLAQGMDSKKIDRGIIEATLVSYFEQMRTRAKDEISEYTKRNIDPSKNDELTQKIRENIIRYAFESLNNITKIYPELDLVNLKKKLDTVLSRHRMFYPEKFNSLDEILTPTKPSTKFKH